MIGGTRGTVGGIWQENGLAFSNQKGGHLSYRTLNIYGHVTKKMKQDSAQQMAEAQMCRKAFCRECR